MSLDALFYPRAVAVVGSATPGKLGYELIRQVVEGGFSSVYVANPRAQGAFGAPGYQSVSQIPAQVDLAVVAAPAPTVADVLEDCGRAGVRAAVLISSGFSEVGNVAGERELLRVARRWGIRLIGPNCAGILNTGHALYPTLETRPPAGATALLSQSGALGGVVLGLAVEQDLGISKFVSYGNAIDVDEVEMLDYLRTDDETRVVAIYLESTTKGLQLMRALAECCRVKPVVVIKSGRSQAGRRATLSHTGSMAGSDAVYEAAFHAAGAVRVGSIEEMFDLCKGFVSLPRLRGRRLAIVTNSGGPAVLATDAAEAAGLHVDEPTPAARDRLAAFLSERCSLKNPIDLTVEGTESGYRETLAVLLQEYDAGLALNICPPYLDALPLARGIATAAAATDKPVVTNFLPSQVVARSLEYLKANRVLNYATAERATAALARLADFYERQSRLADQGHPAGHLPLGAGMGAAPPDAHSPTGRLPGHGHMLEPEAMAWLAQSGFPVVPHRFAAGQDEAVAAARAIGYPVALKVVSPHILHKSDAGGVYLNVSDDAGVAAGFDGCRQIADGLDFRGVVISAMVRGAQEVLLGLSRDPQFGPVVAFGLGGIYTEIFHDVVLRVAPVDQVEALRMIHQIKSIRLLQGARGAAAGNLDGLAAMLAGLSELPFRYPEIQEMDLNPVFVTAHGALVADVRIIRSELDGGAPAQARAGSSGLPAPAK